MLFKQLRPQSDMFIPDSVALLGIDEFEAVLGGCAHETRVPCAFAIDILADVCFCPTQASGRVWHRELPRGSHESIEPHQSCEQGKPQWIAVIGHVSGKELRRGQAVAVIAKAVHVRGTVVSEVQIQGRRKGCMA